MKIISGGQTGVDRAALDAAIERGIAYGGWCPRDGWAEDHPTAPGLLAKYPRLQATPLADPAQRTRWNVRDGDAIMILLDTLARSPGTALARDVAQQHRKPLLDIDVHAADAVERATAWLKARLEDFGEAMVLGVGGPRESESPGIYARARAVMCAVLDRV